MKPTDILETKFTLTFAGNDTQTTNWLFIEGYDKVSISGYWTGSINQTGGVLMQGTDDPVVRGQDFQPNPDAVDIDDLATLANIAPAGTASTVGARDEYENVLSKWIRFKMTETDNQAGDLVLRVVCKSSS